MGNEENKPRIRVATNAAELAKMIHDELLSRGEEDAAADFAKSYKEVSNVSGQLCNCPVCTERRQTAAELVNWVNTKAQNPGNGPKLWLKRAQDAETELAETKDRLFNMRAEAEKWKHKADTMNADRIKTLENDLKAFRMSNRSLRLEADKWKRIATGTEELADSSAVLSAILVRLSQLARSSAGDEVMSRVIAWVGERGAGQIDDTVTQLALAKKQIEIEQTAVHKWKRAVGLSGNATKSDVIDTLLGLLYEQSQSPANSEVISKLRGLLDKLVPPSAHYGMGSVIRSRERAKRTYIAGPMTGYDEHNFPAFNAAAAKLESEGRIVVNPANHGSVEGADWSDYLRADIELMMRCTNIYMLKGWEDSDGARLEHALAIRLGLVIEFEEGAARGVTAPAPVGEVSDDTRMRDAINVLMEICHKDNIKWWTDKNGADIRSNPFTFAVKAGLIAGEAHEAIEGDRKKKMDEGCPEFENRVVELFDVLCRVCDLAEAYKLPLADAAVAKRHYNASRADHKPENRFAGGKQY